MTRKGVPELLIIVKAVRLKLCVLTPSSRTRLQASFKILSARNRLKWSVTPRIPGNKAPGFGWCKVSSSASPGWISITRVRSLPLVVDFLKVRDPPLISVVWSASASDTRQPVNKQIPNSALSRCDRNPSVNNCLNSSGDKIFAWPFPETFISRSTRGFQHHERNTYFVDIEV